MSKDPLERSLRPGLPATLPRAVSALFEPLPDAAATQASSAEAARERSFYLEPSVSRATELIHRCQLASVFFTSRLNHVLCLHQVCAA